MYNKVLRQFGQYGLELDEEHFKKMGQFAEQLYSQLSHRK